MKKMRVKAAAIDIKQSTLLISALLILSYVLNFFLYAILPDVLRVTSIVFLMLAFCWVALYPQQLIGVIPQSLSFPAMPTQSLIETIFKTAAAFGLLLLAYWGFNNSLFLYQPVSYDASGQPITFLPTVHQAWEITFKLGLSVWIIAATLAIIMGTLKITTFSSFVSLLQLREKYQKMAWLADAIIIACALVGIAFILTIAIVEITRVIFYFFDIPQTIFPQLTGFVVGLAIYAVYLIFRIKLRLQLAAKRKAVSVGALLMRQSVFILLSILVGYIFILLFPDNFIEPLMQPVRDIFLSARLDQMGLFVAAAVGMVITPLLGVYLAQLWQGSKVPVAAGVLFGLVLIGWGIAQVTLGANFDIFSSLTVLSLQVFISEQNILYSPNIAQIGILCTTIIVLVTLSHRTRWQESLVNVAPKFVGWRLSRVKAWMARATLFFVLIAMGYLGLGLPTFYYLGTYVFWLVSMAVGIMVVLGFMYVYQHKSNHNSTV